MLRGKSVSEFERGQITALQEECMIPADIAWGLDRLLNVVSRYLKSPQNYNAKKRSERPPKLSPHDKTRIKREVARGDISCSRIKREFRLEVSKTVWREVKGHGTFACRKRKCDPFMTPSHKIHRVQWAVERAQWTSEWHDVIFSDEKKFNLDGPDDLQHYWHDSRQERQTFLSRQKGRDSLMVWGGFSSNGTTELAILEERQNTEDYLNTLETHVLPHSYVFHGENFKFLQDDASMHTARICTEWFEALIVDVLPWTAKSPDLNPIENFWGTMARSIYENGRQFSTVEDIKSAVLECWNNLELDYLMRLLSSTQIRCVQVIQKKGE